MRLTFKGAWGRLVLGQSRSLCAGLVLLHRPHKLRPAYGSIVSSFPWVFLGGIWRDKAMATPGEILRSFRDSRGWSRRLFCMRMNRYGWTEDILRDLEEGSIIFTEDHLRELAEAGLFLHQRISWQQMLLEAIDKQWEPTGAAVITERQPHEDKELETVIITITKPRGVRFLGTVLAGFTGLLCLGNAVAYSAYLYLGASIPFLLPLYESKTYQLTIRHPVYLGAYTLIALLILYLLVVFLKPFQWKTKPRQSDYNYLKRAQPDFATHLIRNMFAIGFTAALLFCVVFIWPLLVYGASLSTSQLTQIDLYAIWLNIQLPLCLILLVLVSRQLHPLLVTTQTVRSSTEINRSNPPSPVDLPQDRT